MCYVVDCRICDGLVKIWRNPSCVECRVTVQIEIYFRLGVICGRHAAREDIENDNIVHLDLMDIHILIFRGIK